MGRQTMNLGILCNLEICILIRLHKDYSKCWLSNLLKADIITAHKAAPIIITEILKSMFITCMVKLVS